MESVTPATNTGVEMAALGLITLLFAPHLIRPFRRSLKVYAVDTFESLAPVLVQLVVMMSTQPANGIRIRLPSHPPGFRMG